MDIVNLLDDPTDPAPELEFMRQWEKDRRRYKEQERKNTIKFNQIYMTEEEFLKRAGMEYDYNYMIEGLPAKEYNRLSAQYVSEQNWEALASLMHLKFTPSLARDFERYLT